MDIQTKHRKSAQLNRPKGRALLALAERKETPLAAMVTLMALAVAALARSAFAGEDRAAKAEGEDKSLPPTAEDYPVCRIEDAVAISPLDFAYVDPDDPLITGSIPRGGDLGRIGLGPGAADISRFLDLDDPAMDPAQQFLADLPDIRTASLAPFGALAAGFAAAGAGRAAGGGGTGGVGGVGGSTGGGAGDGGAGGGGGGAATPSAPVDHAAVGTLLSFEDLFASLADVTGQFCTGTVREISNAAIGDWISQHELYRLRGGESAPRVDPVFLAQEQRTHDLLANPDSREAFIQQHFPSVDFAAPSPERAYADHYFDPMAEPSIDTETHTGLL